MAGVLVIVAFLATEVLVFAMGRLRKRTGVVSGRSLLYAASPGIFLRRPPEFPIKNEKPRLKRGAREILSKLAKIFEEPMRDWEPSGGQGPLAATNFNFSISKS